MRKGKRKVTVLYRRTAEEMTALKEDIEEALNEGISIEYLTSPVEILGDGTRVTGIRCQRMKLGETGKDGRRKAVPLPGTEFVMEADHVVLAIGQRPNIEQLRPRTIEVNDKDSTVIADPLTLETNVVGIFAGGDCITGPSSVVEAMAAGLRVAESIDRYLRGRSLRKGRTLERPQPVDVDINQRYIAPHKRATVQLIPRTKRLGTYEETAIGMLSEAALKESERCLNCALCSECMECQEACALEAVFHNDWPEKIEVEVDAIVNFLSDSDSQIDTVLWKKLGVYTVRSGQESTLPNLLEQASSAALAIASQIGLRGDENQEAIEDQSGTIVEQGMTSAESVQSKSGGSRTGVVLCSCGDSISSVVDFAEVGKELLTLSDLKDVQHVSQACTEAAVKQIAARAMEKHLDRVVVAACRCCNLQQVCFSCTDRRIMCQQYLNQHLDLSSGVGPEFVNIREQCAWVHKDDPTNATRKAVEMISAGIAREKFALPQDSEDRPIEKRVLVLGAGLCGLVEAGNLADLGYPVSLISGPDSGTEAEGHGAEYLEQKKQLMKQLGEQGIPIEPWPEALDIDGLPGNYQLGLLNGARTQQIIAGAVIWNLHETSEQVCSSNSTITKQSLLGRLLGQKKNWQEPDSRDPYPIRELTIGETTGIFLVSSKHEDSVEELIMQGKVAALRALSFLAQGTIRPRASSVIIDKKMCRGCGDCTAICPYIELKTCGNDSVSAFVDRALCLGCGACVAHCPTGAISQHVQSDEQIMSALEALLSGSDIVGEVA
jgi:heterodisulfide reductase subunit A-like polyferredoxin